MLGLTVFFIFPKSQIDFIAQLLRTAVQLAKHNIHNVYLPCHRDTETVHRGRHRAVGLLG